MVLLRKDSDKVKTYIYVRFFFICYRFIRILDHLGQSLCYTGSQVCIEITRDCPQVVARERDVLHMGLNQEEGWIPNQQQKPDVWSWDHFLDVYWWWIPIPFHVTFQSYRRYTGASAAHPFTTVFTIIGGSSKESSSYKSDREFL